MELFLFIIAAASCAVSVMAYLEWRSAKRQAQDYHIDILAAALWLNRGITQQNKHSHAGANACFRTALDGLESRLAIEAAQRRRKTRKVLVAAKNLMALRGEIAHPNASRL